VGGTIESIGTCESVDTSESFTVLSPVTMHQ
jgi:hypothetical protein